MIKKQALKSWDKTNHSGNDDNDKDDDDDTAAQTKTA